MAINSAIIRIRRGPKDDLRIDKLLPGELAMATDAPVMWFCWAPGNVEQVPTSENITEIIAEIIKEYLKDNPVTGISEIYMRVANGYLQYSSDNETWNNLLSIEDITGSDGNDGYSPSVNISKDGKTTTITIVDKAGVHTSTINDGADGADGKDGKDGKTAYQYAQDGGYTGTEGQFSQKLAKEYPSKTSELKNDSGFITKAVSDLANYYLKSETYSQSEINQRLSAIPKFAIQVVSSLPLSGDSATVYLLKSGDAESNLYTEYIYVNGKWEYLGSQSVDLSGYALKTDIPTKLSSLANDAGFITKAVDNLVNYYNKTESDNKYQPKGNYLTQHQDLSGYAKKATTLSGYGITDGATKEQFNQLSNEKANQNGWTPNMIIGTDANGNMVARDVDFYTPQKGVDYWTVADQEAIVQQVITALGTPVFGRVEDDNTIVLTGALGDGTFTFVYEDAEGNTTTIGTVTKKPKPTYINRIPLSVNADGTLYNGGQGWKTNTRLNSSGAETSFDNWEVTGYIPITYESIVYFENIDWNSDGNNKCYLALYDSSFKKIASDIITDWSNSSGKDGVTSGKIIIENGNIKMLTMSYLQIANYSGAGVENLKNMKYFRISACGITNDSIITINEPIA